MNMLTMDWHPLLQAEWEKPYYRRLWQFLNDEDEKQIIYPEKKDIFNALNLTAYRDVKAVLLGQDPYHGQGQAHGLSFSVKPGITPPPSLRNIYKELHDDLGYDIPNHGYLLKWAQQGVLLLNTVLTVRAGQPNSHQGKGWESFTDQIIRLLNEREKPVAFVLWGKHAQKKGELITSAHHLIVQSPHPSPFSANKGFFGSKPFSKINAFLQQQGSLPIDWNIPFSLKEEGCK